MENSSSGLLCSTHGCDDTIIINVQVIFGIVLVMFTIMGMIIFGRNMQVCDTMLQSDKPHCEKRRMMHDVV